MEFAAEFDFRLNVLVIVTESHFSQLDTKSELTACCHLVLILHIGMYISEKQLLVIEISQTKTHALIWCIALQSDFVIGFDDIVKDSFIEDLNFHLKSLYSQK